ncbi:hypothetical protein DPEC_G00355800 [Dallia pectoralis]|uniref:Uncharacterized protein n=1 Tax=Dallia pectoralis TaxID=75939 RepID=A0ACC2EZM9_DALPE|nr:hypothetical protein DPEC_G00355800 [Dallia pectoralis]
MCGPLGEAHLSQFVKTPAARKGPVQLAVSTDLLALITDTPSKTPTPPPPHTPTPQSHLFVSVPPCFARWFCVGPRHVPPPAIRFAAPLRVPAFLTIEPGPCVGHLSLSRDLVDTPRGRARFQAFNYPRRGHVSPVHPSVSKYPSLTATQLLLAMDDDVSGPMVDSNQEVHFLIKNGP